MVVYELSVWMGGEINDCIGIYHTRKADALKWLGRATRGECVAVGWNNDKPVPGSPCMVHKLWIDRNKDGLACLMNTLANNRRAYGGGVAKWELIAEGTTPRFTGDEQ